MPLKVWILDSGASQHFTSSKEDFIDFEAITNGPQVSTASKAKLRMKEKAQFLLSHLVENNGKRLVKTSRIYPVLYIPGLSVGLLFNGSLLAKSTLKIVAC